MTENVLTAVVVLSNLSARCLAVCSLVPFTFRCEPPFAVGISLLKGDDTLSSSSRFD